MTSDDTALSLYPGETRNESWLANYTRTRYTNLFGYHQVDGSLLDASAGQLHLTNFRLIFHSSMPGPSTGRFSIFLPTIVATDPSLLVLTCFLRHYFTVSDSEQVAATIDRARSALSAAQVDSIRAAVRADPDKAGFGTHYFWRKDTGGIREEDLECIHQKLAGSQTPALEKIFQGADAEDAFGLANVIELLFPDTFPRPELP